MPPSVGTQETRKGSGPSRDARAPRAHQAAVPGPDGGTQPAGTSCRPAWFVVSVLLAVVTPPRILGAQSPSKQTSCIPKEPTRQTAETLWVGAALDENAVPPEMAGTVPLLLAEVLREFRPYLAPPAETIRVRPGTVLDLDDFRKPTDPTGGNGAILNPRVEVTAHLVRGEPARITGSPQEGPQAPALDDALRASVARWLATPYPTALLDNLGVDSMVVGFFVLFSGDRAGDFPATPWIEVPFLLYSYTPVLHDWGEAIAMDFFRRHPGLTGSVLGEFVVEINGKADLATFRPIETPAVPQLVDAARDLLSRQHYRPAKLMRCPVPMRVHQRLNLQTRQADNIRDSTP